MRKGTTESGFKFKFDEQDWDDMEFIELMAAADENPLKYPAMIERMLGKEQKDRLYEHCRNEKGRVPTDAVKKEIDEIFEIAGQDAKNSEPSPA